MPLVYSVCFEKYPLYFLLAWLFWTSFMCAWISLQAPPPLVRSNSADFLRARSRNGPPVRDRPSSTEPVIPREFKLSVPKADIAKEVRTAVYIDWLIFIQSGVSWNREVTIVNVFLALPLGSGRFKNSNPAWLLTKLLQESHLKPQTPPELQCCGAAGPITWHLGSLIILSPVYT